MALVSLQNVNKQFGTQVVLDGTSLELHSGEMAGLIGANGTGKTTIFRLIAGEIEPDLGAVHCARRDEIGLLTQEPELDLTRTLHDEVFSVFADLLALEVKLHSLAEAMTDVEEGEPLQQLMADYERVNDRFIAAGGHRMETRLNEILGGLGFSTKDYKLEMSVLSGGQKCRVALAKLLLKDRRLLLLDEPTNHLDIDAVRWLEKFLTNHRGAVMLISHDRYLLDRLCTRIIELDAGQATSFPGNYTNYSQSRLRRNLTEGRQFEKDTEFLAKERAFIAKHISGQRTKEAKGRRTRLERRLKAGEFVTEVARQPRGMNLSFGDKQKKTVKPVALTEVLRCNELSMRFADNVLFTELSFRGYAGQRLGVTGPNGTGKSTLLKIILGEIDAVAGSVTLDSGVSIGYYSQEPVTLNPAHTALEELRRAHPEFSEQQARSILGSFNFRGDDVFKKLGTLSGGEQSRVRLIKLILEQPDLLILDEPTNHLDIAAREALEDALESFAGTILVVSHDRYFLDRVVDRLIVLRPDDHEIYEGNYSFYIEQTEQQRDGEKLKQTQRLAKRGALSKGATPRKGASPYDSLSIDALENIVIERESELATLQEKFGDPAVCRDADAVAALREKIEELTRELAEVDAAWQERVEHQ